MNHIAPRPSNDHDDVKNVIADQTFARLTFSHVEEGATYMNCTFRDTRWIDVSLQHVRFIRCHFENMFCGGMRASAVNWDGCSMQNLEWQKVEIHQSHMMGCDVSSWHMDFSQLTHLGLTNTKVSQWQLADCQLRHLTWMDCLVEQYTQVACHASDVSWIDSHISDASLERCKLERFIAAQTVFARLGVLACTGDQVRATQSQFAHATFRDNMISGASWSHSELMDCQLVGCHFPLAGFDHTVLNRVSFEHVEMPRAMFDGAKVQTSQFKNLHAPGASLRNAHLSDVAFSQSNLSGLDGRGVQADLLKLRDVNCQRANLIGQEPQVWSGAQLQGASFEESKDLDDRVWWLETRPGHRMLVS